MEYQFLNTIQGPDDVKALTPAEAKTLCDEIRDKLVTTVSQNGGHLASNLGVVELTVALHRIFHSPEDVILFDVGHQCYVHKMLTGRYDRFATIRKEDGLSGFMRPDESEHDPFVTGHASNSIAAAYGIYKAKDLKGEDGTAIAVIGDGAMTGGLAFEALNNIGGHKGNFIIVLNDNKMSISKNVGSFSRHLNKIRLRPGYHRFKSGTERTLVKIPLLGRPVYALLSKIKRMFKNLIYHANIFEGLGFNYLGPVDGHDLSSLESIFTIARQQTKPCVVHVITTKGKGYTLAENEPGNYHGVSAFDARDGVVPSGDANFSSVCGDVLCRFSAQDEAVCAITAAMRQGTGLEEFSKTYFKRFFDVGIAEEYAVTFAAGLATGGMKPYFAVYSSFLQRAYDEILHDTAIAGLPVRFLVDRAGIVGEDGETHQGIFDAAFLSTVPGMTVYSPASYDELTGCLETTLTATAPVAVRYPRGKEKSSFAYDPSDFTVFSGGGKTAIVTYGILTGEALAAKEKLAADGIKIDVVKLNKIFPIADELIQTLDGYEKVYLFEEGIKTGGIAEQIAARLHKTDYTIHAIECGFIPAMSIDAAYRKCGLDRDSMVRSIKGESVYGS